MGERNHFIYSYQKEKGRDVGERRGERVVGADRCKRPCQKKRKKETLPFSKDFRTIIKSSK